MQNLNAHLLIEGGAIFECICDWSWVGWQNLSVQTSMGGGAKF